MAHAVETTINFEELHYSNDQGIPTDFDNIGYSVDNDAPLISNNSGLALDEGASASLQSCLAATDAVGADAITYTVTSVPTNGSLSSVTFTQTQLSAGSVNYTHDGSKTISDSFTFKVSDGTNELTGQTFLIEITPINDAPILSASSPTLTSTDENTTSSRTCIRDMLGISVSDADTNAFEGVAVIGTTGNGTWQYNNGNGWTDIGTVSSTNALLLYEDYGVRFKPDGYSSSTATLTYRAWDQTSGASGEKFDVSINGGTTAFSSAIDTASLAVTAVNDAPVITSASTVSVVEIISSALYTATASDADIGDTLTWSISGGADAALFSIRSNGELRLASALDYECPCDNGGNNIYNITLTVSDGSLTDTQCMAVTVVNVNEAPTDITLSDSSIAEGAPSGTVLGTLSTTDQDVGDTSKFALICGTGDTDNSCFTIDGDALKLGLVPDYDSQKIYSIRLRSTDFGNRYYEEALTITITMVNEAPTDITLSNLAVDENIAAGSTVGTFSTTDSNASDTFTYTIVSGDCDTYNSSFAINGNTLNLSVSPDYETVSSCSIRVQTSDESGAVYSKVFPVTVNDINEVPVITSAATVNFEENVTGTVYTASGNDQDRDSIKWNISGTDSIRFDINENTGALTFKSTPRFRSPSDGDANNVYDITITATDTSADHLTASISLAITVTQQAADDRRHSHSSSNSSRSSDNSSEVKINGEVYDAGIHDTGTNSNNQTYKTVTVDDDKLAAILKTKGKNAAVIIPMPGGSDVATGVLTGQMIKNMETKQATIEIRTDSGSYMLPASELNIDAMSEQLSEDVSLSDIHVEISIAEPSDDTVKMLKNAASDGGFTLVVPAVDYKIRCSYKDQTVEASSFSAYVERTIAIPDGVDSAKITTGIVVDADGTVRHVPTKVVEIDGKWYGIINSLTNSTYSLIWNPVEFTDVENHWAKEAINDMGSRMIISGGGNYQYEPNRDITRAEFAAIVVRVLGVAPGSGENTFNDIAESKWYCHYIETAKTYGIINGYGGKMNFGPNDKITREQAMTMIARAMKLTGLDATMTDGELIALLSGYADATDVSSYATKGIGSCIKTGITFGTGNDRLSPGAFITRAEVAVMVQRLLEKSGLI